MSDPVIATYEFVSLLRRGAAADLALPDPLTGSLSYRGTIQVQLTIESTGSHTGTSTDSIVTQVQTHGPGDVIGIDPRHIIRTDPRPFATDFEPNYFPEIEFEHPDFPWLFTPAAADTEGKRLRPWVALIALTEDEFDRDKEAPHPLPRITVKDAKTLPPLDESWAWAHAQISGTTTDLASTVRKEPGRTISRLICARRLRARTRYHAFLVPTFALGVLAGTGATVPSPANTKTEPAWKPGDTNKVLPVYYQFEFATSEGGDFESLARQLTPRILPPTVGVRPMSVPDQPAWNVPAAGVDLGLAGALRAISATDTNWSGAQKDVFQADLQTVVNRGALRVNDSTEDPRLTPPLYGRWHAAVTSVNPAQTGWINDLNLDPRPRAMAGFGTEVVRQERARLLTAAWKQFGAILEANHKLKAAQAARAGMRKVHEKHLQPADDDALLNLTSPVHQRLRASPTTIASTIARSRLPSRALSPAFRRIVQPLGPIRRRQGVPLDANARWATRLNSGDLRVVPPPHPPGGLTSIEDVSDGLFPSWAPDWLRRLLPHVLVFLVVIAVLVLVVGIVAYSLGLLAIATVLVVLAIVLFALAAFLRSLVARWKIAEGARLDHITTQAFVAEPPRPNFKLVPIGSPIPPDDAPVAGGTDSADAAAFRVAGAGLARALAEPRDDPPDPPGVDVPQLHTLLLNGLLPDTTLAARIGAIVAVDAKLNWRPEDPLEPVMAAPVIDSPMYEPLRDLSQDFLLPGLKDVQPNTVSLLQENHAFIEAYLVGANVEFGRMLLYADFPTDQRLSSFRQFWDVRGYVPTPDDPTDPEILRDRLRDIPSIHLWSKASALGQNRNRQDVVPGKLVLLIRGQLVQRYPTAVIYATETIWDPTKGQRVLGSAEKHALFRGTLSPDVTFFGFDLMIDQARGSTDRSKPQGWWFVIQQQPSEPRFGLEPAPEPYAIPTVKEWNDLSWANFAADKGVLDALEFAPAKTAPAKLQITSNADNPGDVNNHWSDAATLTDAAQVAYITLRRPARVAIHAEMMLPGGP